MASYSTVPHDDVPPSGGFVSADILDQVKVGKRYVAAKFGFRNHWYPVRLSSDFREGEPIAVTVLGENLLMNRVDGVIYAVKDQCLHRGVNFSRKYECYKKGTVTCWYHGFTYRLTDGVLCDIVGTEHSAVVGKRRIKTYPVKEVQNLVFVYVGDEESPPPIERDVPPTFLDEDRMVLGQWREVAANWRVGVENGFDSTHIFIHKESVLIDNVDLALPLGLQPKGPESFVTETEGDGPVGIFDNFDPESVIPVFEGTIEGETVLRGAMTGSNRVPMNISMWLPCALRVQPWPVPELTQFEWYVPVDGERHLYFQALGKQCATDAERAQYKQEFVDRWVPKALNGFNDDDVWAREATHPFYADDRGWIKERLFEPDGNIVAWRRLASRYSRGIQMPENIDPPRVEGEK